ncbi:MAG: MurR/RpiR family transcriptional regulator [Alphaproteobacteria bacterium]|nr:MurR/RpiR family transcriptional regulator [Alphaproteobacteria bacterium]
MAQQQELKDYEELIRVIHENHDGMSKAYQQIAVYLTQNPNDVAVKSLNAIADSCGIHASSFVRFAQSLGYDGFKELQAVFQKRLTTAAPGFDARVKALRTELSRKPDSGPQGLLNELVLRDIASLQDLMTGIDAASLEAAISLMEKADTIYLAGQLRSAPIVELMRYILTMLGKRTVLLDASGGLATHMAGVMRRGDLLFAVAFRFYATEVVNIVEAVAARDVPVIAITDSTLSPLAKNAKVFFAVPEHEYTFSRSLAAPMCLAQALAVGLAAKLQRDQNPRIPIVTQP